MPWTPVTAARSERRRRPLLLAVLVVLAGAVSACAAGTPSSLPATPALTLTVPSPSATPAASPTASASPAPPTPTLIRVTPTPVFRVCSPLQGFSLADLTAAVANPYSPPPFGSDDPHQGVDLAQLQDGIALSGLPVQALLEGVAVMTVKERFPYGNALLVEARLEALPSSWLDQLDLPSVPAAPRVGSALTCPTPEASPAWVFEQRSLYLLYAHLLEPPLLSPGDQVTCGQVIGAIGSSGNALNPHLHLEVRVGPAGARFPGMAHYDTAASPEEMSAYCQWRVSGGFLHIDPLLLLAEPQP